MVTIYDIAKKTGFSVTTVSKALNNYTDISEKTKKKILDIASDMGYFPNSHARTLATKKSWSIGAILSDDLGLGITHPFFNSIIESFKQEIESKGYDLLFISNHIGESNMSFIEHCKYRSVDGVIIFCSDYEEQEIKKLINSSLPSILIDLHIENANFVHSDNKRGSELAVEYIKSLGHTKIAHISSSETNYVSVERKNAYIKAMKNQGLELREEYLVDAGYFSFDSGYMAMNKLLDLDVPPTAVFVAGDHMAIGAIRAVQDKGLSVPNDISIVGFDDIKLASFITPSLTTIRQDTKAIGKVSADILIDKINGKPKPVSHIVPVELVERESCKKIK